jgi:hypothetical protein
MKNVKAARITRQTGVGTPKGLHLSVRPLGIYTRLYFRFQDFSLTTLRTSSKIAYTVLRDRSR